MTALAVLAAVAVAFAGAIWFYRTRELPVRGRSAFALLRGATLALLVVLLWNPTLPGAADRAAPPVLVVDASGSMSAAAASPGPDGTPADRARLLAESFDGAVEHVESGLADAAARAVEAGAERVVIASDLRAGEGVSIRALAAESSVPVEVADVGGDVANAGISELSVPERARPGEEVTVTARVHATTDAVRRIALVVAGDTVATAPVSPGAAGTDRVVELRFRLSESLAEGADRLVVEAVLPGGDTGVGAEGARAADATPDAYPEDDRRIAILPLDDPGGGIVAVSWAPDWELRTLVPLLDEVSGLPARAFHALGEDRWLRASADPAVVDGASVREALSRAEMVVLHAAPPGDTGLVALARSAPRRIELASASGGAGGPGASGPPAQPPQPGEWYVAADLPASPVAAELAGLELLGLPPLSRVRPGPPGSGSPIELQRGGAGEPVPAFDLRRAEGERVVVARAEGFWRWALRDGDARELYRRLWSGLAAWALAPDASTRTAGFGPADAEVRPGEPVRVRLGAAVEPDAGQAAGQAEGQAAGAVEAAAEAAVEIVWTDRASGVTVRVDTIPTGAGPLATVPGFDRRTAVDWSARVIGDGSEGATTSGATPAATPAASGTMVVQPDGTEMRPPRDTALVGDVAAIVRSARPAVTAGTLLRDTPWPWLLLVFLLSAEWIGRRRAGLR